MYGGADNDTIYATYGTDKAYGEASPTTSMAAAISMRR